MGWLKALQNNPDLTIIEQSQVSLDVKFDLTPGSPEISHFENISTLSDPPKDPLCAFHYASLETPDENLPIIPASEIQKHDARQAYSNRDSCVRERLWIVIDNVVFDCTNFAHDHPGGRQVIESFSGQDCSWQFWRFHSKDLMREWGRALRVGRTEGVKNRWKERPRFVGLRKFGKDECD